MTRTLGEVLCVGHVVEFKSPEGDWYQVDVTSLVMRRWDDVGSSSSAQWRNWKPLLCFPDDTACRMVPDYESDLPPMSRGPLTA